MNSDSAICVGKKRKMTLVIEWLSFPYKTSRHKINKAPHYYSDPTHQSFSTSSFSRRNFWILLPFPLLKKILQRNIHLAPKVSHFQWHAHFYQNLKTTLQHIDGNKVQTERVIVKNMQLSIREKEIPASCSMIHLLETLTRGAVAWQEFPSLKCRSHYSIIEQVSEVIKRPSLENLRPQIWQKKYKIWNFAFFRSIKNSIWKSN